MIRRQLAVGGTLLAATLGLGLGLMSAGAGKAQPPAAADQHPGQKAYQMWCAACHNGAGDAPSTEAVRQLSRANIRYTLELGYMKEIARNVPRDQIQQIIDWLPLSPEDSGGWTSKAQCTGARRTVELGRAARTATSFGLGVRNNRAETAAQAGLKTADMRNLELAWTVAFPQTATMRSQPVIVGKTLFIAATDSGHVYALDADTGCVKWTYSSDLTLRSSLAFAEATKTSPARIVMGDAGGRIHAVDARTGQKAWVTDIKLNSVNRITGAPVVHDGKVFAPLSAIEVNYAGPDAYECCQGQGAVVALDLATGSKLWVGRTMEEAKPTRKGRTGVQQWGPSGAIIWSTPIVDAKRGLIYAGTGENTSWPATETSDAIIAYDIKTGARRWVFQATKADIWNYACGQRGANCDWPGEYQSPDHDFGATPMLITRKDGKDLVVAGQKSGALWAIDPDTGKLVWSNKVGRGSAGGGMRWGLAFDGERIFAPQNDPAAGPG
ncbi:MAG: glucose dehydrogenase, partial [Caulobacteraceae bacterium]|nr:glucose dehydrogenase [Caulobacteraceae bacterium]